MQLYFVGSQNLEHDRYMIDKNVHRLFSYADKPKKRLMMYNDNSSKVFMDSGAYGVAHSNKEITLDEYIEFINNTPRVTLFASLDVIPYPLDVQTAQISGEQSWNNYIYILEHVKDKDKVVPTYHYGETNYFLEQILNGYNGYKPPYIAFGGRGGVHSKDLYPALTNCLNKLSP